jgi:hypothetical protein
MESERMSKPKSEHRSILLRLDPESEEVIRQVRMNVMSKGGRLMSETETINHIIRSHPALASYVVEQMKKDAAEENE